MRRFCTADRLKTFMKSVVCGASLSVFILSCLVCESPAFELSGDLSPTYCVTAPIAPISKTPGLKYSVTKEGQNNYILEDHLDIIGVVVYGNHIKIKPSRTQWAMLVVNGEDIGYIPKKALQEVPAYKKSAIRYYWAKKDRPELFLQPGRQPVAQFGFSLLRGEVVACEGFHMDKDGSHWLLLSFSTAIDTGYSGIGARFAWARESDFLRLDTYKPDLAIVLPEMVPSRIRGSLKMERGGYLFDRPWLERISRHGFWIDPRPIILENIIVDDMADLYDSAEEYVPQFITTDMFFHAYHLIFDRMLQKMESEFFAPALEKLLKASLRELDEMEHNDPALRNSRFSQIARDMFALPLALLTDPSLEPEKTLSPQALMEYRKILAGNERSLSVVTGSIEDYSQYGPRSHYTLTPVLGRYFRAMSFLGNAAIPLRAGNRERELHNASAIALICLILDSPNVGGLYKDVAAPLRFMMGGADDNSVEQYIGAIRQAVLEGKSLFSGRAAAESLHALLLSRSRLPRVIDKPSSRIGMSDAERKRENLAFRVIGKSFAFDAYVFARLTSPLVGTDEEPRNLPDTLDIMTVLGSTAARTITNGFAERYKNYAFNRRALESELPRFFSSAAGDTAYTGWLKVLAASFQDSGSGQFFYRNGGRWEWKKLLSASASWAELKHDTMLYAKQSGVEMGSGSEWTPGEFEPPRPRGYVEPEPQVFDNMLSSVNQLREMLSILKQASYMDTEYEHKLHVFGQLCQSARDIALKEVENRPLTAVDFAAIEDMAGSFTASLLLPEGIDYPVDEKDRDMRKMALVADVASDYLAGRVLHVGTGTPRRIFVYVDDNSAGPRVAVGYVYSYYEFDRDISLGRMTDQEWKTVVYSDESQSILERFLPRWHANLVF